ncbi:hypothetical protein L5515_006096 [Caenorhabditis briggsae]|uniref:Uncharacterized protein n=1 Tax=Caenorhabditis briggsae TaxID=6238 RepID=A0AAE9F0V7_CAEBR|nr:hypothetical protein L5515_006096 [Caenorhabditis briggsae]
MIVIRANLISFDNCTEYSSATELSFKECTIQCAKSVGCRMQTTTPRPKVCPDQWRMFQRGSIQWCLSVVIGQNYSIFNYTAAVDTCLKLNSTLSGPNGVEERDFAFQFTDLTLQNFTGYTWNRGEPNGDPVPPGNYIQNCIHMLITPQVSHTAYGTLDDIELRQ